MKKLGCEAPMKVRGDDHLEGVHSLCHFLREISSFLCHFLETLTETGSIHWVGVQTWLRSTHEGKRWWPPRGGSFVVTLFEGNLLLFAPFLETLTETGSIHWVGVQTWLQSTHEGKRWWPPRGGSFIVSLFEGNLLLFVPLCQVHCVNGNKVNTFGS